MSSVENNVVVGAPVPQRMPWAGLGYKPVEGYTLPTRKLMRKARKNMRAILAARAGNHEIAALLVRMEHVRKSSRAGFHQKLRYFLEVERDYIAIVTRKAEAPAPEAGDKETDGSPGVDVQSGVPAAVESGGARPDDGAGVHIVEDSDDGAL